MKQMMKSSVILFLILMMCACNDESTSSSEMTGGSDNTGGTSEAGADADAGTDAQLVPRVAIVGRGVPRGCASRGEDYPGNIR